MAVSTRPLPAPAERLLAHVRLPIYRNAYALVLSSATTSGLGVVYWTLAARLYSPEAVGLNAAAISAMMFLAGVAQLNLMSALVRFIPTAGSRTQRLIVSAYALSMLLALAASLAFMFGADRWAPNLRFLASSPLFLAWFTAATMGWCIFVLQDSAMTGLRQATWVLVENAIFAVVKIGLLVGLAVLTPEYGVFASWTLAFALALLPTNYLIFRHLLPKHVRTRAESSEPLALGPIVRYVTSDNLGSLCWLASTTLLPVLVVQQAGAPANAYFYLAWQVAYALHLVSSSMASSLVAEASADPTQLRTYTLRLLRQTARVVVPLVAVTVVAAPFILRIFGEAYVTEGTPLLRLLALGAIPNIFTALFIAAARVRRRMRLVVGLLAPFAALVLGLTYVLLHVYGLTGVGVAWLVAQTAAAGYILLRGARLLEAPDAPLGGVAAPAWLTRALALVGGPLPRLVAVVVVWVVSLQGVDASRMNDLGLVSILSWPSAAALALLCLSFGLLVRRPRANQPLLVLHILVLIGLLHATPAALYGTLRYSWAWKHVGIVDYIQRHGSVDPTISALNVYHNWPGFFVLSALATQVAGLPSALSFASWAPPFFNVLFALGGGLVARAFTRDLRLVWLTVWFFCLTNWIGQDYFSPQAMNYFLYLVVVGICLRWLGSSGMPAPADLRRWLRFQPAVAAAQALLGRAAATRPSAEIAAPAQRAGLLAVVVLLAAVVASSHQLTPFMLFLAVTGLVVFQQCRARGLPLLVLIVTVAWVVYMAVGFLDGNLYWIVQSIGRLTNNVNATLIDLSVASPGQRFIALVDRSLSAAVGLLAVVGLLRRLRQGYWDLSCALLTVSPLPMLAGNAYGGEILFRIYFFALPFMAFFAAAIFYPSGRSGTSWRTSALAIVVSCGLLAGFCVAYWGKDRMYHFSPGEVQATEYLDSVAPSDTLLVDGTWNYPWPSESYERYTHLTISLIRPNERTGLYDDTANYVASLLQNGHHDAAYLLITRSQKAETEMTGVLPAGTLDMVEEAVSQSSRFQKIFSNADARIFTLAETHE